MSKEEISAPELLLDTIPENQLQSTLPDNDNYLAWKLINEEEL